MRLYYRSPFIQLIMVFDRILVSRVHRTVFLEALLQFQNALVSAPAKAKFDILFREYEFAVHQDVREFQYASGRLGVTAAILRVQKFLEGIARVDPNGRMRHFLLDPLQKRQEGTLVLRLHGLAAEQR